jgi:hypothetical protein
MRTQTFLCFVLLFCILLLICPGKGDASPAANALTSGQMLYVPAYSHIYSGNSEKPFLLTVILSIRNTNLTEEITVTTADYYETQGKKLRPFVTAPVILKPLESIRYVIPEKDKSGGSGANFIVKWQAAKPVNQPVVETIMIGTQTQQGISFTSRAVEIVATP